MEKDIQENANDFLKSRPQRLCLKCGDCCRVVTKTISHDELNSLSKQGDKNATDFLEIFEQYESIETARAVNKEIVDNIINVLKEKGTYDRQNLTFYKCKHLLDNNLCKIYENRKELCKNFPSSPWTIIPLKCGFTGWLFQKREYIKQKIRKQKENILNAEALLTEARTEEQKERIKATINEIKQSISLYEEYGSKNW